MEGRNSIGLVDLDPKDLELVKELEQINKGEEAASKNISQDNNYRPSSPTKKQMEEYYQCRIHELQTQISNINTTANNNGTQNFSRKGDADLIPMFKGEMGDNEEFLHFQYRFDQVADQSKWTALHKVAILEAKLAGKAREKYFEGVGRNKTITAKEQMQCLRALFVRNESLEEMENQFYACIQRKGEPVVSFKYRMESLAAPFEERADGDTKCFHRTLNRQFMRGLRSEIVREVAKMDTSIYEENVKLAIKIETGLEKYRVGTAKVNVVNESSENELDKLKTEIGSLKKSLKEANARIDAQNTRNPSRNNRNSGQKQGTSKTDGRESNNTGNPPGCKFCKLVGHEEASCYKKNPDLNPYYCAGCGVAGHSWSRCRNNQNNTTLGRNYGGDRYDPPNNHDKQEPAEN